MPRHPALASIIGAALHERQRSQIPTAGMLRGWSVEKPQRKPDNLASLVKRVTFHNEDSGFCVQRVKARGQRNLITVVGHAAVIGAGEFVQASGQWVNDRTHGVQFRADFLRAAPPTTAEGIEKHLASDTIKGTESIYAKNWTGASAFSRIRTLLIRISALLASAFS
jgi:exodeoxyribonuclease V alpha subunit